MRRPHVIEIEARGLGDLDARVPVRNGLLQALEPLSAGLGAREANQNVAGVAELHGNALSTKILLREDGKVVDGEDLKPNA